MEYSEEVVSWLNSLEEAARNKVSMIDKDDFEDEF